MYECWACDDEITVGHVNSGKPLFLNIFLASVLDFSSTQCHEGQKVQSLEQS